MREMRSEVEYEKLGDPMTFHLARRVDLHKAASAEARRVYKRLGM